MLIEQDRLIKRCNRWKNSLVRYLSLPPTSVNVEEICHSSTYLISWLNDLRDCDEEAYENYLLTLRHHLSKASEVIFNHFYFAYKSSSIGVHVSKRRYMTAVERLAEHTYCVLWCSYYAGSDDFIDHVYNVLINDIVRSLPPASGLKGRREKRIGRIIWDLLTYFEKFLDYDIPSWAIQKFQTKALTKPKITEDETYKIMLALDSIELSNPNLSDDIQYRFLRGELLTLTERGSRERRRILGNIAKQKCECGSSVKLMRSEVMYYGDKDSLILVTTTRCGTCGRSYNMRRPVEKTKAEFDAIDQLNKYLESCYGISLIAKIQETTRN
ncbi:MAG: hypothetical protein ACUVQ8_04760 [Nitrososphaeria archaeon]